MYSPVKPRLHLIWLLRLTSIVSWRLNGIVMLFHECKESRHRQLAIDSAWQRTCDCLSVERSKQYIDVKSVHRPYWEKVCLASCLHSRGRTSMQWRWVVLSKIHMLSFQSKNTSINFQMSGQQCMHWLSWWARPWASLKMFFFLSMILREPSGVISPMSPVWNQPSESSTCTKSQTFLHSEDRKQIIRKWVLFYSTVCTRVRQVLTIKASRHGYRASKSKTTTPFSPIQTGQLVNMIIIWRFDGFLHFHKDTAESSRIYVLNEMDQLTGQDRHNSNFIALMFSNFCWWLTSAVFSLSL